MRLEMTRRTDYAVRAMLVLARNPEATLSSTELATTTQIPVRFVTQVMANVVKAGLATAVIGRSGGYRLARDPETVSVLSVVEAVEGDVRRQHCTLRGGACERSEPCEIHAVFSGAQEAFVAELRSSTLAAVASSGASPKSSDASPGTPRPVRDAGGSASRGSS